MSKNLFVVFFSVTLFTVLATPLIRIAPVYAQSGTPVECGEIIEDEFIQNNETHVYLITMVPKESFDVAIEPAGDHLLTWIKLLGPTDLQIVSTWPKKTASASSGVLSARGTYKILVQNADYGVGQYKLTIGCTTRNGIIKPGDKPLPTPTPAPLATATVSVAAPLTTTASFSGVGFPGLAPVDFSDVASIPLDLDTATAGVIPLDNQILGFTLDAKANDVLDLSYKRKSGNLNLGLVVLSASNKVVFQASLVTSESLMTRFTLPEAGKYAIGVFRINLVNPAKPQATAFQLLAKLNAK